MRDRDDVPYIVIEKDGSNAGAFILGALVGAGLALLFAPRSGTETQEEIKDRARRLRSAAEDRVRDAQRHVEERLETARENVGARVDSVKEAVESGREAARQARSELEEKLQRSKIAYRAGVEAARDVGRDDDGSQATGDEPEATGKGTE